MLSDVKFMNDVTAYFPPTGGDPEDPQVGAALLEPSVCPPTGELDPNSQEDTPTFGNIH